MMLLALALQGAGPVQDFKSRLGAEPRHAAGKLQFVVRWLAPWQETPEKRKRYIIPP